MGEKRNQDRKELKLHDSLDSISKYGWDQIGKNGNLRYLIKDKKKFSSKNVDRKTFEDAYFKLMDEFFEIVGEDQDREELMLMKKELVRARVLLILGDKFQENWIKVYEAKIQVLVNQISDVDPEETYMQASKWLGNGLINTKKISVYKWLKLLKTIQSENQMMKEAQENAKSGKNE